MPFNNLSDKHFTEDEKTALRTSLKVIDDILNPKASNLNATERKRFGVIGETKKLIINKVKDFLNAHRNKRARMWIGLNLFMIMKIAVFCKVFY